MQNDSRMKNSVRNTSRCVVAQGHDFSTSMDHLNDSLGLNNRQIGSTLEQDHLYTSPRVILHTIHRNIISDLRECGIGHCEISAVRKIDHSAPGTLPTFCISYRTTLATQRVRTRVRIRVANGTSAPSKCYLEKIQGPRLARSNGSLTTV